MKHPESWFRWLALSWRRACRRHPHAWPYGALLIAVAFFGLTGHNVATKHLTSWKQSHWSLSPMSPDRSPAAFEGCTHTNFRSVQLKLENAHLEKSFPTQHDFKGQWLHFDLAKLNFAQARFLSRLAITSFRPHAAELATCHDMACLYNVVSGDSSQEYGVLAWHWYLKTGMVLQWKGAELSFTKNELHNLWALAGQLPTDFFHQHALQSMEKTVLKNDECSSYGSATVKFAPRCAATEFPETRFQQQVAEGMAKALIPAWNQKFPGQKDALNPFSITAYIVHNDHPIDYVDFYKEQFLRRTWTLEGDMQREFKRDQWVWRDLKSRHLKDCLDLHKTALLQRQRSRSLASLSEPHPMAQCLRQTAIPQFLQSKRIWLTSGHPRSCEWNKALPQGQVPVDAYLTHWESLLKKDIDQLEWRMRADGPQWVRDYQAKEAALARLDPTWVYFDCHNGVNPKSCYQQGLTDLFTQQGRLPASVKEELLEDYPFEALEERVSEDVGSKRQWFLHQMEKHADRAWRSCWKQGPNEMVKVHGQMKWVNAGTDFIDGRFASCLEKSSEQLLEKMASGDSPESRYWRQEVSIPLKDWWQRQIAKEASFERNWLRHEVSRIKTSLGHDLQTLMKQTAAFDPATSCLKRLTFHYPPLMYFHDRQQLNNQIGAKLCREVLASPALKEIISQHNQRRWKLLGGELQAALSPLWQERVRLKCLGRVPASQTRALLQNESVQDCMKDQFELTWPVASAEVAERHDLDSLSLNNFKDDVEAISQNLLNQNLQQ